MPSARAAITYNMPGGWVRVEAQCDPHFVHLTVHDNGLGMTGEQKAQLFQPFNRLGRERSSVPGTGIEPGPGRVLRDRAGMRDRAGARDRGGRRGRAGGLGRAGAGAREQECWGG